MKSSIITIRPFTPADANAIFTYASQPELARYTLMPKPYTMKDAKDFIARTKKNTKSGTSYEFGIELIETGDIIGGIGFTQVDTENKHAEIGYVLNKHYWGRGIMTEALTQMITFGFTKLKLNRIEAKVFAPNIASAKLLEKLGFTHEGTRRRSSKQRGRWMDEHIYGLLSSEWKTKK